MRVLCSETADKSSRMFLTLSKANLLEQIKEDRGYHEVIPMIDHTILLRIFVDIDTFGDTPSIVLNKILSVLNERFETLSSDWAISSCNRDTKISYHIFSKKYCMQLVDLRDAMNTLKRNHPEIDTSVYWFDMNDHEDNGYFRLPNQTKNSINKPAPALKIESGELADFLVTDVEGLVQCCAKVKYGEGHS